jgi:hypothetical protein
MMTKQGYQKWDLALKIAAPIITVVGLLVGIAQFSREQENAQERESRMAAENDALEFKRRIWERQLETYMTAAQVVGEISVVADRPDKLSAAVDRFYTLYWGSMIFLEDAKVREQMIRFHIEIQDYLEGIGSAERLKIRAADLVDALRASSHASWKTLNAPVP